MGWRFLRERYQLHHYSDNRAALRLNEGDFEPHQMWPYGLWSGKFSYRQIIEKRY